jgi:hypothetical protein
VGRLAALRGSAGSAALIAAGVAAPLVAVADNNCIIAAVQVTIPQVWYTCVFALTDRRVLLY